MFIYAGIDEAGYGPFFGPMTVGRCVLRIPKLDHDADPPDLWARLNKAVCRRLSGRKGRLVVNDSKKLTTKAAGIKHLEMGCLAFASLMHDDPAEVPGDLAAWLDAMGEQSHRSLHELPWYTMDEVGPWAELPVSADEGELAIARNMLRQTCGRIGVEVADLGCAVILEDRFNRMVDATRSKAAVSFTFVAGHLQHIWQHYGEHHPTVVVDRQSGRMRYRDTLAMNFPEVEVDVLAESPARSSYRIECGGGREMTVVFQTSAEENHMPVALASMIAKYNRELMMERFKAYFTKHLPEVAPTAGYGSDAKRFWQEVQPHLQRLKIAPRALRRHA
ncbi:hypothetical protein [Algisphaera agarilytica]|uniref:Ribonuclease n=1 Tax=Algisphaera agarilytica TaxID=1385975 RepID=A0A7X0LL02_9BACT|nr:hypothetical protein [Algisphaera agarilytica]MBB6429483.1 ribonuclease HII [Algisphaera agarilytica]